MPGYDSRRPLLSVWFLPAGFALVLALAVAALLHQRRERSRLRAQLEERSEALRTGSAKARLQYPAVDLQRCIGCGTCVRACPEEGVLEVIHGQALVVHGARCVGHGRCAAECPVGAIALTLGDLSARKDIPVLADHYEAPEVPGLYLAGEVTGFALIRTAIEQGKEVAQAVAERVETRTAAGTHGSAGGRTGGSGGTSGGLAVAEEEVLDLLVVGAGPAGIACGLQAKEAGLTFQIVDQEGFGGTVARYPRRKLVMTQTVTLPLYGEMRGETWAKEELVALWQSLREEYALPVDDGVTMRALTREADGSFTVHTDGKTYRAHNVCLALGRRGTPRRLGVPGEPLPKVAYALLDAQSYRDRRILVVGGGDSAVEAAIGLAEQPGNRVTLSYRKESFFRIKARNRRRLEAMTSAGALDVLYRSQVKEIHAHRVEMLVDDGNGTTRVLDLANDEVFVMAGGIAPISMLQEAGIGFDHAPQKIDQTSAAPTGLLASLTVAMLLAFGLVAWTAWHGDYYGLEEVDRVVDPRHAWLRPSAGVGLGAAVAAIAAVFANLLYLVRRAPRLPLRWGSLRRWMTVHVATGLLALMAASLHAGFDLGNTVGGHALLAMGVVVGTGALGRYFYSFVPRAANGRELELEEIRSEMTRLSAEWDRGNRDFGLYVRDEVDALLERGRWGSGLLARIGHLLSGHFAFRRRLIELRREGREQGIPAAELGRLLRKARRGYRIALGAAHLGDLRGLLASWRFLHRWIALFLVLLLAIHVYSAVRYGEILPFGGGR